MKKFIDTVNKIILPIRMMAAFTDSLSAAFTAFTEKWAVHFPESLKQLDANSESTQ